MRVWPKFATLGGAVPASMGPRPMDTIASEASWSDSASDSSTMESWLRHSFDFCRVPSRMLLVGALPLAWEPACSLARYQQQVPTTTMAWPVGGLAACLGDLPASPPGGGLADGTRHPLQDADNFFSSSGSDVAAAACKALQDLVRCQSFALAVPGSLLRFGRAQAHAAPAQSALVVLGQRRVQRVHWVPWGTACPPLPQDTSRAACSTCCSCEPAAG